MEYSLSELDSVDRMILRELQQDTISQVELAKRIALSPPAVHARVKRLEEMGILRRYVALVDREKLGYDLMCIVGVTLQRHQAGDVNAFHQAVQQMSEVMECFSVTGEYDYLLKVVARSRKDLERILLEKLTLMPGVARITTSIVLSEVKNSTEIVLE
jgi:Lrp/AsnC family transcriptional regulator, leucine-responsive regulatory protein